MMPDWMKPKLKSRLLGETSVTTDTQMTSTLWQKVKRTKVPPDESERGEWKSWLKIQHSKMKFVASGPITSWQIEGETMERVIDFIFLGSKSTAYGDRSHEKLWQT